MTWVSRKQREFKENVFVFDDEEELEEEEDEESGTEDENTDDESTDSDTDEGSDSGDKNDLLSYCENLLEKIDKLRKS